MKCFLLYSYDLLQDVLMVDIGDQCIKFYLDPVMNGNKYSDFLEVLVIGVIVKHQFLTVHITKNKNKLQLLKNITFNIICFQSKQFYQQFLTIT